MNKLRWILSISSALALACATDGTTGASGRGDDDDDATTGAESTTTSATSGLTTSSQSDSATTTGDKGPQTDTDPTTGAPTSTTSTGPTGDDSTTATEPEPMDATIYDIQNGTIGEDADVRVTGAIVTAKAATGLWIQDPNGGAYSGVWVYAGNALDITAVQLGDTVSVIGYTNEEFDRTEINASSGGSVTIDSTGGEVPAAELLSIAELTDPTAGEQWESVLVRTEGTLTIEEIDQYHELIVSNAEATIFVDNFLYSISDETDFANVAAGASFTAIEGPLNYSFNNFKIAPRSAADYEGYAEPE